MFVDCRDIQLIRLVVAVNTTVAAYSDVQASAVIAAEVKERVAGAVAVAFI